MTDNVQTHDQDGIRTLTLNVTDNPVNAIGPEVLGELEAALDDLTQHTDQVVGLVIASGKPNAFCAGADLFHVRDLDDAARLAFLERGQRVIQRIADLAMPTTAAINGVCLGGGLELALACDYRVVADNGTIRIGLPEVMLGILPGWGGATRMTRCIGVRRALPLLLTGKSLAPRRARKLGLVDDVVRPEALHAAACRLVRTRPPRQRPPIVDRCIHALPPLRVALLRIARRRTLAKTYGHYPAAEKLLDLLRVTFAHGDDAGFRAVREGLVALLRRDESRRQLRLFFLRQEAKHAVRQWVNAQPLDVHNAAVIGGGTMGAGIAYTLVRAGVPVRLLDVDEHALSAALRRIRAWVQADRRAYRLSPQQADQLLRDVAPATDWSGLGRAELVIEAVPENLPLKRRVFARLDELARPDAVLATNTSALDITALAQHTNRPPRIVGMHFFNPVPRMPLVEVVQTRYSDEQSLATALGLAQRLGKTPALVRDAPGFLVNRLLFGYLTEALVLATEGADVAAVDRRMRQWGMPMGPYELLDTVGLDVAAAIFTAVRGRLGEHLQLPGDLNLVMNDRWLGRKTGCGFYRWQKHRHTPPVNHALLHQLQSGHATPTRPGDDTEMRLIMPMINEMARVLDEGIVPGPAPLDLIDLATLLGLGWAPFRGGLARYARTLGPATIVQQLNDLAARYGPRFAPAPPLVNLAEQNASWETLANAAAPAPQHEPTAPEHHELPH